jgi:hypothetical protein
VVGQGSEQVSAWDRVASLGNASLSPGRGGSLAREFKAPPVDTGCAFQSG